jgi:hypothetical protein
VFRHWRSPSWSEEDERFADGVAARAILVPTSPNLAPGELAALRRAAAELGEDWACGSCVERISWSSTGEIPPQDVAFSLGEQESPEPIADLRHVVHSPSGRWGRVLSLDYAVAGGDERFVEALLDAWPSLVVGREKSPRPTEIWGAREHALQLVCEIRGRKARGEPPPEWLVDLLEHVGGSERARDLLARGWVDT